MPRLLTWLFAFTVISFSATAQSDSIALAVPFSTDSTHLTAWNGERYVPFFIKGVNLGVSVPGTFPGQLAATRADYDRWFEEIHTAGFNLIRLYTLHYPRFYSALDSFNRAHPNQPLYFVQGVWLEEEIPNYDHDLYSLNPSFHDEMLANVRSVHGDTVIGQRFGKAYGTYTADVSKYCLSYLIGREIHPEEVVNANLSHSSNTEYNGEFLSISVADPAEVWATALLDSLLQFEFEEYQTMRPVALSSWPTLDPIEHPEETFGGEDSAQFDLSKIDFSNAPAGVYVSYHAYPYYPDFISKTASYRNYSDAFGSNSYLGYLHDLKSHYANMPLLIAEFGVPSSWGVAHYSASNMNHGGHTEREQGEIGLRLFENIETAQCAGGIYFAWIDEWFKRTWVTDPFEVDNYSRIRWPNYTAAEQNFGLLGYTDTAAQWTLIDTCATCDIHAVYAKPSVGEFQLFLESLTSVAEGDTLWIAFDTYDDIKGESVLPNGSSLNINAEFLLRVFDGKAELFVMRAYDLFGIWHGVSEPDQLYHSVASTSGDWRIVRWKNNQADQDVQYIGNLRYKTEFRGITSMDAVVLDTNSVLVRIPWTLLQVADPSQRLVIDDDRNTAITEFDTTEGIRIQIRLNSEVHQPTSRLSWPAYIVVNQVDEQRKQSYWVMMDGLPKLPDFTLTRTDSYTVNGELFTAEVDSGVLANDEQWSGASMVSYLANAPSRGFIQLHSNGAFSYQPESGFVGTDSWTYVVNANGDVSVETTVTMNVTEAVEEPLITLAPVPTDGMLTVYSALAVESVQLIDIEGRTLQTLLPQRSEFDMDLSTHAGGTYFLRFKVGEDEWIRKVVVY